ncbi:MAG: DUF4332 domain-containing protein [Pseudomonadota bacterium]
MSLLYRILYAAHANGTHHKLALRGVAGLGSGDLSPDAAPRWRALFLSEAPALLEGSKAPDKTFKDFQNHCLHVADDPADDWGGAMRSAEEWYAETVARLREGAWPEAAYAAGVLSHYYTDPLMPFHTGSSDAETIIHRAAEWSVSKSFETLLREKPAGGRDGDGPRTDYAAGWVGGLVREGAVRSHARYQLLIDHYDFAVGAKTPEKGFDAIANDAIAGLLRHGAAGFTLLLERACLESGATPPARNLTARTAVAGLKIPAKWVINKLEDAQDRAEVARIFAEFTATGQVQENLPVEQRVVRRLSGKERNAEIDALRAAIGPDRTLMRTAQAEKEASPKRRARRPRLTRDDAVEKAPSIGPKTAARLESIGVSTVGDLLEQDPKKVASGLGDRRITAKTVAQWRDQARLLTRLPGLKTADAVMLAACGYRDVAVIAEADPGFLREQMAAVALVDPVKRALRGAAAPSVGHVKDLVDQAKELLHQPTSPPSVLKEAV